MYQMPAMAYICAIATERGCKTNLITVPLEEGRDNFSLEKLSEGVLKHRRQQHHKNARKELLRLQEEE